MKKIFFIATISLILLASCRETKKDESVKTQNTEATQSPEEMSQREDSIQQVKSHGHAH